MAKGKNDERSVADIANGRPPTKWRDVPVDITTGGEAWDWDTDGLVCTGVVRGVRVKGDCKTPEGTTRPRAIVTIDVESGAGEVSTRALFLPPDYEPAVKRRIGRWLQVQREGRGVRDTRYTLREPA